MGARGPAPTPTAILELRGSSALRYKDSHPRSRDGEPRPANRRPSCPSFLQGEARKEWNRVVKELLAMGCLAELDRGLLASYCEAFAEFMLASQEVGRQGRVVEKTEEQGKVIRVEINPWMDVREKAFKRMAAAAREFGLSPSLRTRIRVQEPEKQVSAVSEFARRRQA